MCYPFFIIYMKGCMYNDIKDYCFRDFSSTMNMKSIRAKIMMVFIGLLFSTSVIFSVISYYKQKTILLNGIDEKLRSVVFTMKSMLPEDFHDRITDEHSVSPEEYYHLVDQNNQLSVKLGLQYIWSVMVIDGKIYFTTATSPDKDVNNGKHAGFFEVHRDPGAFDAAFHAMKPHISEFHNEWGDGRMILSPYLDSHGRLYSFGASMSIESVNSYLRNSLLVYLSIIGAIMAIGILICYFLANSFSRPIRRLTDMAEAIADEKTMTVPLDESGGSLELDSLYRSIKIMHSQIKQKMEALRESEERFIFAQAVGHVGVWDWNPNTGELIWSDETYRILGLSPGECRPGRKMFLDMVHTDDRKRLEKAVEAALYQHQPYNIDCRIIWKDGSERMVHVQGEVRSDADGRPLQMLGTFQDITERKRAEKEQERLNKELEQKNKELEQIVYISSHDLRTPLVNVEGHSGELEKSLKDIISILDNEGVPPEIKERLAPIIEEGRESMEYISKGVSRMESLLNGLLHFFRSGRVEIKKEELDMNILMSGILSSFKFQVKENGAKIEISELPSCMGDERQINQLFSNLIGNAFKYCDPDRPCIIKISGQKENDRSVYCVEDNGIGMVPEYHKKIFEIFHQLNPGAGGEGLGLSIVRKIVERHNGRIWVESEPGKGSRFYVSL